MTNGKNDVAELEELLTELEGQGALPVGSYSEDDDVPTQQMEAPVGDQEWMVQLAPLDRRMMSGDQVRAELASGDSIGRDTLVWRGGMSDWTPISRVDELSLAARAGNGVPPSAPLSERRLAPLPPPPVPMPPRVGAGSIAAPVPLPPVPLPPVPLPPVPVPPSAAFGLPRPTPAVALPALHSAFNAPLVPPTPAPQPAALTPAFQVPPAAAAPTPAPPVFGASRNNTTRPVAVDFGELAPPSPPRPLRTVVASGVAALLTVIVTVYSLSRGGVFESGVGVSAESGASSQTAAPAPSASQPAAASSSAASPAAPSPAEPPAAEPEPEAAEAQAAKAGGEATAEGAPAPAEATAEAKASPERRPATREPREAPARAADVSAESQPAAAVPASAGAATEPAAAAENESAAAPRQDAAPARVARMLEARRKARAGAAAGDGEATEAAPAPAKARRSSAKASAPEGDGAAVSAGSDVDSDETPKDADKPGSTFDRNAAKIALDGAANQAKNCRPQGGPSGPGRVQVRYEPSGKVGDVAILTPKFDNTTAGSCVMMVFKRASIPSFSGAPSVVLTKGFEIP